MVPCVDHIDAAIIGDGYTTLRPKLTVPRAAAAPRQGELLPLGSDHQRPVLEDWERTVVVAGRRIIRSGHGDRYRGDVRGGPR